MEKQTSLAERVKLVWSTIDNDLENSSNVRILIYTEAYTYIGYQRDTLITDTKNLRDILEYLREKNVQIAWKIIEEHFHSLEYRSRTREVRLILSYACNGDILMFGPHTFYYELVENVLETFRSIRFDRIKIFHDEPNDELLSLVWHVMRTDIYYASHGSWPLYVPED